MNIDFEETIKKLKDVIDLNERNGELRLDFMAWI